MKHKDHLIIKTDEMMAILQFNKAKTYRVIAEIRKKSKKEKSGYITVAQFCWHTWEPEEKVRLIMAAVASTKKKRKKIF